jgi:hypothetical protein
MTRREELQKQYAEYERKLDELRETAPENEVLKIGPQNNGGMRLEVVYSIESDIFDMENYEGADDDITGSLSLSGDEAEKLYHFLRGLYEGKKEEGK